MNMTQFQHEIAKRDGKIALLESRLDQIERRLGDLESKPKRGRPAKAAEEEKTPWTEIA